MGLFSNNSRNDLRYSVEVQECICGSAVQSTVWMVDGCLDRRYITVGDGCARCFCSSIEASPQSATLQLAYTIQSNRSIRWKELSSLRAAS